MNRVKLPRLLLIASLAMIAVPMSQAQSRPADSANPAPAMNAAPALAFDVISIRPTDPDARGWRLSFTVDGFIGKRITLLQLIQAAYAAYEDGRIVGGPSWVDTDYFDILARIDPAEVPTFKDLTLDQRRQMLRTMLAERFQLVVHTEQRTFPAFALRIAKSGPKLHKSSDFDVETGPDEVKGYHSLITRSHRGLLEGKNFSMPELAKVLEPAAQRVVVDETGLKDRYDFLLQWTPLDASGNPIETSNGTAAGTSFPFFFPAVERELGLKLEPTKTSLNVYVIDRVQQPSGN